MIPSASQGPIPPQADAASVGSFANPRFRAQVQAQARELKQLSELPDSGEIMALAIPGLIRELQSAWDRAAKLGFSLERAERSALDRRFADLDYHDVGALSSAWLTAIGATESLAREMNRRLPSAEQLELVWSPECCPYAYRLERGTISRVHGPGGRVDTVDDRVIQFRRDPPN